MRQLVCKQKLGNTLGTLFERFFGFGVAFGGEFYYIDSTPRKAGAK